MYRTRAELRDAVRRLIGRVPASELGGKVGDPLPSQPTPTNSAINDAIDEAIAELNRAVLIGDTTGHQAYSVSAQTTNGPCVIQLKEDAARYSVISVQWNQDSTYLLLEPSMMIIERTNEETLNTPPGVPQKWWTEGDKIALLPAPATSGTALVTYTMGIALPEPDTATITGVPEHLLPAVTTIAARRLLITELGDYEMQARSAQLAAEAAQLKLDWQEWYARRNLRGGPTIDMFSYRRH